VIAVVPSVSPVEIKAKIEDALKRSAQLEAKRISVESSDGRVTLRGTVHSWAERDEAESAAWRAPGVREVHNEIDVSV
jgi:osmotically-inducible protein OsmY